MLAPDGQQRVKASDASGETHGTTITRPETCSGRRSRARLIGGDLALGLVAVDAAEDDRRRPVAVRDDHDRDRAGPGRAHVRRARDLEQAELLARRIEVDRAANRGVSHRSKLQPRGLLTIAP